MVISYIKTGSYLFFSSVLVTVMYLHCENSYRGVLIIYHLCLGILYLDECYFENTDSNYKTVAKFPLCCFSLLSC